jgi:hypothetical protein
MASSLIRRDQFEITPEGITHLPTGARLTPGPADAGSGVIRSGRPGKDPESEDGYDYDELHRIMRELWAEYLLNHPPFTER